VAKLLYEGPWVAERHAAMRAFLATHAADVHPVTRAIVGAADRFSATDAFEGLYRLAALKRATEGVWEKVEALVVPTAPIFPTLADLEADPIGPNSRLGTYTNFVNLLDLAALSVPGPFRADGLPAGITLIGPRGSDAALARLGAAFVAAAGEPTPRRGIASGLSRGMTMTTNNKSPGEAALQDLIEIVVVGAHLSGMPLNGELTSRGATFRRVVQTLPDYRLYALAGGPPKRPGLIRVAPGTGAAIACEVWALPPAGFGTFVDGIPSPLGIGTLKLADGTTPKGFLVEPVGLAGAEDITAHGGWRAYVAALSGQAA
jgi:allophanate hydrolase